jgi:hypothetical protein
MPFKCVIIKSRWKQSQGVQNQQSTNCHVLFLPFNTLSVKNKCSCSMGISMALDFMASNTWSIRFLSSRFLT